MKSSDEEIEKLNRGGPGPDEDWWHKTMTIRTLFYWGKTGRWRMKCWHKPVEEVPHCIHIFEPEGFLAGTLMDTTLEKARQWIDEFEMRQ